MLVIKRLLAMLIITAGFIAPYILLWQFPPITSSHWVDAFIYFAFIQSLVMCLVLEHLVVQDTVISIKQGHVTTAFIPCVLVFAPLAWACIVVVLILFGHLLYGVHRLARNFLSR